MLDCIGWPLSTFGGVHFWLGDLVVFRIESRHEEMPRKTSDNVDSCVSKSSYFSVPVASHSTPWRVYMKRYLRGACFHELCF